MENFIHCIIEFFKTIFNWYFSTDLPRATSEYVLNCVTYITEDFIPLMWEYYYTIFGIVGG